MYTIDEKLLLDGILVLDGIDLGIDGFLITKIIMLDRLEVFIKFIDKRYTGRNVESGDIFIGDVVKILDKGSQRISMGSDENLLSSLDFGNDGGIVIWNDSGDGIL